MHSIPRLNLREDPTVARELRSLEAEQDPELYFVGLNHFAGRLAGQGRSVEAGRIWSFVAEASSNLAPQSAFKAQQELKALHDDRTFGQRVEVFSRRFLGEAIQPSALLGMVMGGGVYSLGRGVLLNRLLLSPAGTLTRGLGARFIAGLGAFALEAPAFTLATRGFRFALDDPASNPFHAELASSYLSLGGLRLVGATGHVLAGQAGFNPVVQRLIAKSSAYSGVVAGQSLERKFGLRPSVSTEDALFDGLETWVQAQLGGHLLGVALGPRWSSWQSSLQARSGAGRSFQAEPLGELAAKFSPLLCGGCSEVSAKSLPLILGVGGIAALGVRDYLRSAARDRAADAFQALPLKTWKDLQAVASKATGLSPETVDTVLMMVLRYGTPAAGSWLNLKGPLQKIAVQALRLPAIKRRGVPQIDIGHIVLLAENTKQEHSYTQGFAVAYSDRIRGWLRDNAVEVPAEFLASPQQIADRASFLTSKVASTFALPTNQASRLVELMMREEPSKKPGQQKGQLYEGEFPKTDPQGWSHNQDLNNLRVKTILNHAGMPDLSIPWFKEVVIQLAAECRVPIPLYSMRPIYGRLTRGLKPITEEFTESDWMALHRLRDAVWGPWRLPWEEIP